MSNPSTGPPLVRRRVAKACQPCRVQKSKCDGGHPSCGRCRGYGYRCSYSADGRRGPKVELLAERPGDASGDRREFSALDMLTSAVTEYDQRVRDLVKKLPKEDQNNAQKSLAAPYARVQYALSNVQIPASPASALGRPSSKPRTPVHSQRYLGEVSDVQFFNLVKRVLQNKHLAEVMDDGLDSYEQDDPVHEEETICSISVEMPGPEIAEEYLDIYFSTIHVAYPFIQREPFLQTYRRLRDPEQAEDVDSSWTALLYIIFAIGAYYRSFPGKDSNRLHEDYFQRALSLSNSDPVERSVNQVCFLLVQSFYLLAVCKTDRCWTTLGLAIRVAQSIGLHVESEDPTVLRGSALFKAEARRRIWYSLFVLDRLLSLQLGRPPAIHDGDFNVLLPSRLDDAGIDWTDESAIPTEPDGPSTGDYFLLVIELSKIIGYVLRDLYSPRRQNTAMQAFQSTQSLDKQLLGWKATLPRTMRFDFGHAFETSVIFRRQRNMLAIKFYHLRALIYRPYLCLPLLRHHPDAEHALSSSPGDRQFISRCEKICVSSAQETAHLLRNVSNERELVHDFPWWQMISCLICASSILLVASVFTPPTGIMDRDFELSALDDDAETCLKVFEALSANSDGARIARDMMARLKEHGIKWRDSQPRPDIETGAQLGSSDLGPQIAHSSDVTIGESGNPPVVEHFDIGYEQGREAFNGQDWPSEILDSMAWSAQFFDAVHQPGPS